MSSSLISLLILQYIAAKSEEMPDLSLAFTTAVCFHPLVATFCRMQEPEKNVFKISVPNLGLFVPFSVN